MAFCPAVAPPGALRAPHAAFDFSAHRPGRLDAASWSCAWRTDWNERCRADGCGSGDGSPDTGGRRILAATSAGGPIGGSVPESALTQAQSAVSALMPCARARAERTLWIVPSCCSSVSSRAVMVRSSGAPMAFARASMFARTVCCG